MLKLERSNMLGHALCSAHALPDVSDLEVLCLEDFLRLVDRFVRAEDVP